MIGERKFILANRIVWFVLCLICFIIPAIYGSISTSKNLKIVSHNGYILEYYESLDTSDCEIVVTFNESVYSGDIVISFMIAATICYQLNPYSFLLPIQTTHFPKRFILMEKWTVMK